MGNGKLLGKSNELLRSNHVMNWLPTLEGAENQDKCQLDGPCGLNTDFTILYPMTASSLSWLLSFVFMVAFVIRFSYIMSNKREFVHCFIDFN